MTKFYYFIISYTSRPLISSKSASAADNFFAGTNDGTWCPEEARLTGTLGRR